MKPCSTIIAVAAFAAIACCHALAQDMPSSSTSTVNSGSTSAATTESTVAATTAGTPAATSITDSPAGAATTETLVAMPVFSSTEAGDYAAKFSELCGRMVAASRAKDYAKAAALRAEARAMYDHDTVVTGALAGGEAAQFTQWKSSLMSAADTAAGSPAREN